MGHKTPFTIGDLVLPHSLKLTYKLKHTIITAIFMLIAAMSWAQQKPVISAQEPKVGEVRHQSAVFTHPIWDNLRQGQRDSARAMTWHDYTGLDTLLAWNSIEGGMAKYSPFSGKDSILIVRLDDGNEAIYRKKCKNRNRRELEPTSKGAYENPSAGYNMAFTFNDNRAYQLNIERAPLQQIAPTPFCCPKFGETEFSAYFQIRHLSGNILLPQGTQPVLGIEMINRKLFLGPDNKVYGRPLGWKSIAELYMEAAEEFEAPCDTCGVWVLDPGKQLRIGIGLGSGPVILDWHPFKDASWFSMRFALLLRYETKIKKSEHAGWSGFFFEPETEFLFGRPTKLHGKIALAANWHPFPSEPTRFGPGAWNSLISASIVYPFANKEEVEERRVKKAEVAAKKAQQDTLVLREQARTQFVKDSLQFITDNLLVDSLLEHGDTIAIDSAMKVSDPVPQENKFWELKGKREARKITELNTAKSDVYYYVQRFNFLYKAVDEDDDSLRLALAQTYRKLELAQKNYETVKAKHAGKEKKGKTPASPQ